MTFGPIHREIDPLLERFITAVFLTAIFVLSLSKIEDPDAWIHLMNGKVLWEIGAFPPTEQYIYSLFDQPYLYTSWFFATLYYGIYHSAGVNGVILFNSFVISLTFFVMLKTALRGQQNRYIGIIVLFGIALICRHRFTERPDTQLFLWFSFSVFALESFFAGDKRFLYLLPLVHLIWANAHSSISLMVLPFFAYTAAGHAQGRFLHLDDQLFPVPSQKQLRTVILMCFLSFLASVVNPNGVYQYSLGLQFYRDDWIRKNVMEMFASTWAADKELYIIGALVAFAFLLNYKHASSAEAIIWIPLFVLALLSRRFMYPFFFVSGPFLARNISSCVSRLLSSRIFLVKRTALLCTMLVIVLVSSLTLANVEPFGNLDKDFGFGVNTTFVPEGALRYMDAKNVSGRIYNSFHWGQYVAWRDYPKRSVIMDGRFNASPDILWTIGEAPHNSARLTELYNAYRFEAILIDYVYDEQAPSNSVPGYDARLNHPDWALVYWDDNSSLYLRRNGPYASVVREDEYMLVKPANNLRYLMEQFQNGKNRARILFELKRNTTTTDSISGNIYLGQIYSMLGRYQDAIGCFSRVRDHPLKHYLFFAQKGAAYAYEMLGDRVSALDLYKRSYRRVKDPAIKARIQALSS